MGLKDGFSSEDLYKLNEALFNLPENELIDNKTTSLLFQIAQKVMRSYRNGRYDQMDTNFVYDYVGLLSTMQNQPFFSQKQSKLMLSWLLEATCGDEVQDVSRLQEENKRLSAEIEKLKVLAAAVQTVKNFKPIQPLTAKSMKTKAKASSKNKSKGSAKGSGGRKAKDAPELTDVDTPAEVEEEVVVTDDKPEEKVEPKQEEVTVEPGEPQDEVAKAEGNTSRGDVPEPEVESDDEHENGKDDEAEDSERE